MQLLQANGGKLFSVEAVRPVFFHKLPYFVLEPSGDHLFSTFVNSGV